MEKKELLSSCCFEVVKILFDSKKEDVHDLLILENVFPKEILSDDGNLKYHNFNLSKDQKSAVEFALKRKHFAIVQGPPGTGKTTTLIEIIVQLFRQGKKVNHTKIL